MKSFVPRDKMSKRARKKLDAQNRMTWGFNPTTKIVKIKKVYDRKKQPRNYEPYDSRGCFSIWNCPSAMLYDLFFSSDFALI